VEILRRALELRGFEIDVARSGQEALARVAESVPDVVLLDIMMPNVSGMDVLKRIRGDARTAEVPVIFVTAKTEDDDVLAGYQFGADYYITKPFTIQQLLYGIDLVLGQKAGG